MKRTLLSVAEVARLLKVSPRRVRAMVEAGRLPAVRFGRRAWAIRLQDLAGVMDRRPGRPPGKRRARP